MWIYPQKPVRISESFLSKINPDNYVLESKYDGFRALLTKENGIIRMFTRNRNEMIIPENLISQINSMDLPDGVMLDGEVWTPSKRGSWVHDKSVECSLTFWDIMAYDGKLLIKETLEERQNILQSIIEPGHHPDVKYIQSEHVSVERIREIREEAVQHKTESKSRSGFIHGVVLKRKGSVRRDHVKRSVEHPDWLKIVFWDQN
jgi:ATP-dependent DNA ligase